MCVLYIYIYIYIYIYTPSGGEDGGTGAKAAALSHKREANNDNNDANDNNDSNNTNNDNTNDLTGEAPRRQPSLISARLTFLLHFSICACHPCAGAILIFSVSFQF